MTTLKNFRLLYLAFMPSGTRWEKTLDGQRRDDMNAMSLRFKYALRQSKLIYETVGVDSMAGSLHCINNFDFWKEVGK